GNSSVATGLVFSVSGVEYTAIIYGDCNGDGMINAKDTQAVADYITGKITLDRAFLIAAGVTDGGNVTIENALVIQRHVYGLALIEQ
ncbi:MAG: dockerin type I repeat-containing protein, partial [Clostridia bacterium]|nr:dockerin type I repeat-containing protein [Clostridia bacterium]